MGKLFLINQFFIYYIYTGELLSIFQLLGEILFGELLSGEQNCNIAMVLLIVVHRYSCMKRHLLEWYITYIQLNEWLPWIYNQLIYSSAQRDHKHLSMQSNLGQLYGYLSPEHAEFWCTLDYFFQLFTEVDIINVGTKNIKIYYW